MRYFYLIFSIVAISCTVQNNRYLLMDNGARVRNGRWVENDRDTYGEYISKGKYKNGEKTGRWKTKYQGKKYHLEKFRKGYSVVKFYHPNGKLMETGRTETIMLPKERIWQKTGNWQYYDNSGKLLYIRKYIGGKSVDSISKK